MAPPIIAAMRPRRLRMAMPRTLNVRCFSSFEFWRDRTVSIAIRPVRRGHRLLSLPRLPRPPGAEHNFPEIYQNLSVLARPINQRTGHKDAVTSASGGLVPVVTLMDIYLLKGPRGEVLPDRRRHCASDSCPPTCGESQNLPG